VAKVDAGALAEFDTSALAVLLELQRAAPGPWSWAGGVCTRRPS
jgi:hypothetical protein